MDIQGTQSYKNIEKSFANESKAIIKYLIYADIAIREGNTEAAELFKRMAKNEIEHAKTWFRYIHNTQTTTAENLKLAANTENAEWKTIYPEAAIKAKQEELDDIAAMFEKIASIECDHERRFVELSLAQESGEIKDALQSKERENSFSCLFCGLSANHTQDTCPVCGAENSFIAD